MKAIYNIVGMQFRGTSDLVASMRAGEPLMLEREPNNKFDSNAVQVWGRAKHLAFIKGSEAAQLAAYMDRKGLKTMLGSLAFNGRWPCVEVEE